MLKEREPEFWDAYDLNRLPTGNKWARNSRGNPGDYRMIVLALIFNTRDELLAQLRSPEHPPEIWTFSAGGSAMAGETSQSAIQREVLEEIGLDYDFTNIRPKLTIHGEPGFFDYYIINAEPDISSLRLQASEVQEVKWMGKPEIRELIRAGKFIQYSDAFLDLLFELRDADYPLLRTAMHTKKT